MSASVSYKGETIVEIDNETKVLNTAGTWLEDDLTITEESIGGGVLEEKEVTFYDYDGTILYAYTPEEFLSLSAMPTPASDEELASSGWNWSFADARAWVQHYGMLAIGNMRYPADGSTRIIVNAEPGNVLEIVFLGTGTYSGTIDWGDETTTTITRNNTHEYSTIGQYAIRLHTEEGSSYTVTFAKDNNQMIEELNLGLHAVFTPYANYNPSRCLKRVSLPTGLARASINFLNQCYLLQAIVFPDTFSELNASDSTYQNVEAISFPNQVFNKIYGCPKVRMLTVRLSTLNAYGSDLHFCKYLVISDDCSESTNNQRFQCGRSLEKLYLSDLLTSMGTYILTDLYKLKELKFSSQLTTVSGNTFTQLWSLEKLVLPPNVEVLNGLNNLYSIKTLTIPATVTSIANNTLSGVSNLRELHFLPTTPPTIGGTATFSNLDSKCVIYVPYSADHSILDAYKAATNLSRYATQMVEEEP